MSEITVACGVAALGDGLLVLLVFGAVVATTRCSCFRLDSYAGFVRRSG